MDIFFYGELSSQTLKARNTCDHFKHKGYCVAVRWQKMLGVEDNGRTMKIQRDIEDNC